MHWSQTVQLDHYKYYDLDIDTTVSLFSSFESGNGNGNNATNSGSPFTETQVQVLNYSKAIMSAISIFCILCYLTYIFVRSFVGLTFFFVDNYRANRKRGKRGLGGSASSSDMTMTAVTSHESWKDYWRRMRRSCLFLSNPLTRILVCLQLAEMMDDVQAVFDVFGWPNNHSLCLLQALMSQYFGFSKLCWGFVISIWMIWILVLRKTSTLFVIEIASHLIAWGTPIIVAVVPLITKSFGKVGTFCWIKDDQIGNWLRFGLNYIPLWVIISATVVMYLFAISWIARTQYATYRGLSSSHRFKKVSTSLTLYIKLLGLPLISIMLWLFPTISRSIERVTGKKYFALVLLMNVTRQAHGFFNTLLITLCAIIGQVQQRLRKRKDFIEETDLGDQRTINGEGMYENFLEMDEHEPDNEEG